MKCLIYNILIIIFATSCSKTNNLDCHISFGKLLFNAREIDWKDTYLGHEYKYSLKIYNPSNKTVKIKILENFQELKVFKAEGKNYLNLNEREIHVRPQTIDSVTISFSPIDTTSIGNYRNGIHFIIDSAVIVLPLKIRANILYFNPDIQNKDLEPILELAEDTINFGIIPNKKDIKLTFNLKNAGGGNLIIYKIETSCSCTSVLTDNFLLQPGESKELIITFNAKGREGKQHKIVKVFCNDPQKPIVTLVIEGFIKT